MDKTKQIIYFIPIFISLLFFLPECSFLGKLEAEVIIRDYIQDCDNINNRCGRIYIYYNIKNTGDRAFDYYSVLFMVRCEDGSEYREWDFGYKVDVGEVVDDSVSLETKEKKVVDIVVDDVILDFPHSYGG